jgi:oligopeptide transport system permease protein
LRAAPSAARWDLATAPMEAALAKLSKERGQGLWSIAWQRLRKDRAAFRAFWFLALVALTSTFAPLLPLPSPIAMNVSGEPLPPQVTWGPRAAPKFARDYWNLSAFDTQLVRVRELAFRDWQTPPLLGTDSKGRDLLSRLVWGSRTSLFVAFAATLTSLVIGVLYGAIAGLSGGFVDRALMRVVDGLYALPFTFVVIFVLGLLGAAKSVAGFSREAVFFVAIGALFWLSMARVVRGQVLSLKHAEFVQAARAQGAGSWWILAVHVVPNVLSIVVVFLTLTIPSVILSEAFLSFLGLGVEPPKVSWGLLAVDALESANPLRVYWWLIVFPSLAIAGVLLALTVLGDGLRDALDPAADRRGALR